MSDGTILKADKDFTPETDKAIPEAEKLAEVYLYHLIGHNVSLLTIRLLEWQSTTGNRPPSCAREADPPSLRLAFDLKITRSDRDNM
jgi:hypothetical protein